MALRTTLTATWMAACLIAIGSPAVAQIVEVNFDDQTIGVLDDGSSTITSFPEIPVSSGDYALRVNDATSGAFYLAGSTVTHTDFTMTLDVLDWETATPLNQGIGLSNGTLSGVLLNGYALLIVPASNAIAIVEFTNSVSATLDGASVSLDPSTNDYVLVFERSGTSLSGYVANANTPTTALATVSASDGSFTSGSPAIVVTETFVDGIDATVDNFCASASSFCTAAPAPAISWVPVGDPGNAANIVPFGAVGAVETNYEISEFEVTNAQYAAFLNAVADTDANALYDTAMGSGFGGITRSGTSGDYEYVPITGREDMPVNHVTFFDAQRFANWLHNGQPTGVQDATTTEDGAYDFSGAPAIGPSRKAGAQVALPSDDEWYKAAYYKGGGTTAGYWDYPAGSDTPTTCAAPGATANTANCDFFSFDLTDVGAYTGAPSPYGTSDQGGNVWEWAEGINLGVERTLWGGALDSPVIHLFSGTRGVGEPDDSLLSIGFRVVKPGPAITTSIDWVAVGDPGNAADTTGYGAVANPYRISKFEVTNAHYAVFLNAVAATDANALYVTAMGSGLGGITRSGTSGSYAYTPIAGRENLPVNYASFFSAQRFANWLHNGEPTGVQDASTTEDGAYDFDGAPAIGPSRKAGAQVFLPSEDEWYKAAYYKGGSKTAGYWDYPAGSDTQTSCAASGATANTANCANAVGDMVHIGVYTGTASPYGTFDQGGNVWEWTEGIISNTRNRRGGTFDDIPGQLAASFRTGWFPNGNLGNTGFRVASFESAPPVPSLGPLGVLMLGGLLGLAGWRRSRR